jgi:4-hydroxy-tetrahydrodipicolinate reductase
MDVIIHGAMGRMGRVLETRARERSDVHVAACIDHHPTQGEGRYESLCDCSVPADALIDFSNHSSAGELTAWCAERRMPLVIATTGHTPEERALIDAAAERIPVFLSANMSIGVAVTAELARRAAAAFPGADIEIIEIHHNRKLDVPSGTALMLADAIREERAGAELVVGRHTNGKRTSGEIGIHSVRLGNETGTHEILISTGSETITIRHKAEDRALFADGALAAAAFLQGKAPGLYTMKDLIG